MEKLNNFFKVLSCAVSLLSGENTDPFPLEQLPLDMQNEIAQYLIFNSTESDAQSKEVMKQIEPSTGDKKLILYIKKKNLDRGINFNFDTISLQEPQFNSDTSVIIKIKGNKNVKPFMKSGYMKSWWTDATFIHFFRLKDAVEMLACYDSTGIYLIQQTNSNKPTWQTLKQFPLPTSSPEIPRKLVDQISFNKQGTKLGVRYTQEGQMETLTKIELLKIPGKVEPKVTLRGYFREKLIKNNLGYATALPAPKKVKHIE